MPPASEFSAYEKTCKGAAERILTLAENSQKHVYDLRMKALTNQAEELDLKHGTIHKAMVYSFVLCLIFLVTSAWLIYSGHEIIGTVFSVPAFVAVLRYYLGGLLSKRK